MLNVSDQFINDTTTGNSFLVPLVIFEWGSGEKIYISTNSFTFDGNYYAPLLKTVPSLTESIGIQSKKYKISSINLKISNYKHGDTYFSDSLTDSTGDYIIGGYCNIYYKSQGMKSLGECVYMYRGIVRNIDVSSSYVSVRLEDLSQELFYKDIPANKLSGGLHIMEDYRNAPYPMVYGDIDRSPCIIGDRSIVDDDYHQSIQVIAESETGVEILNNLDDIILNATVGGQNGDTTFNNPQSYLMFYSDSRYASINKETYDMGGVIGSDLYNEDDDLYYSDYLLGDQTNVPYGETVGEEWIPGSNPNIIMLKGKTSADSKTNLIASDMAECFYVSSIKDIKNWGDDDFYVDGANNHWLHNPTIVPFSGSHYIVYNSEYDFVNPGDDSTNFDYHTYWAIRHAMNMQEPPNKKQYKRRSRLVQGYATGSVTFNSISVEHPDILVYQFGYTGYTSQHSESTQYLITQATSLFGDGSSPMQNIGDVGGQTSGDWYEHNQGLVELNQQYLFNHYSRNVFPMPGVEFGFLETKESNAWVFKLNIVGQYLDSGQVTEVGVSQLDLDLKVINLYHAKDIMTKKLFCKISGRRGINGDLNPPSILIDIIQKEILNGGTLAYDLDEYATAINAQADWQYAFTIFERENSKKIIENIAKESKSFIFVNNLSDFSFVTILDKYEVDTYTPEIINFLDTDVKGHYIDVNDVLKLTIKRTRLRDIKTKIELLYHYDYGHKNHIKTTADNIIEQTAIELFPNYLKSYYGISEEQGDSPIELNYIRDDFTANELHRYLLAWYCNQHTIFRLRLPLKYLKYEIGDVIAFKDLIEGRKAYGEDYSFNKRILKNEKVIRNGQEIFPFFMITKTKKTLNYVDIEAIQLHNLINVETEAVNLAPTARATFELSDDGLGNPPDVYDATSGTYPNIILDGTGSTDPEDDGLTYEWIYDESLWTPVVGDSLTAQLELQFTGTLPNDTSDPQLHIFRLKVDDGTYSHISNPVRIYIINSNVPIVTIESEVMEGWNFVSCPVIPTSYDYHDLFPSATSGTLYEFTETYVYRETLEIGKGYWLHFQNAGTVTFVGYEITEHTYQLSEDWNVIGGISEEFNIENFIDENNIIEGEIFLYTDVYSSADTIEPGKGYWVKTSEAGEITIST